MNVTHSVSTETDEKNRMLHGHDVAAGIAHALPGVTYLLATAKGLTVPVLIQYGTLLVIAVQLTYWIFRITDLIGHWLRRRRR